MPMFQHRHQKIRCRCKGCEGLKNFGFRTIIYKYRGVYIAQTKAYGKDRAVDWFGVATLAVAKDVAHGSKLPDEYLYLHNALWLVKKSIDRELNRNG